MKRTNFNIVYRLIGLIRPLLFFMFLAISMGVIGYFCAIFITVSGGFAILNALKLPSSLDTRALFIAIAIFAVLRGILRYAEQASNHYIAFKLLALIRDKVFCALRKLAPAKLSGRDKGNLIALITSDIELLEVFYAHTISPVAIAVIVSGIMSALIARYHLLLGLTALVGYISIGGIIPIRASKRGKKTGADYRHEVGEVNSYLLASLRGLRESIQFGDAKNRSEQINRYSIALSEMQGNMKNHEGLTSALTNTAILFFSLVLFFLSILLLQAGMIAFDGLLISFIAIISSFGPVVALSNLSNNLIQTFAAAGRVLDILDEKPQTYDISDGFDINFDGASCKNLSFAYDKEVVLQDCSLSINKGEIAGIVGKSGSGKSTLLKLFMRFWSAKQGSLRISDRDINTINTSSLRVAEALVSQETELFSDTIENNIKIARLSASHEEVVAACKKAAIHDFIISLPKGYKTLVSELGSSLSGGEIQRIGIARAFLHDSPFILLDEPTSNLDSLNEGIILDALQTECTEKTVLLVSHRSSTMSIASQVYSAESGRLS